MTEYVEMAGDIYRMWKASEMSNFLFELRQKLSEQSKAVLNHVFFKDAEEGKLPVEKIRTWCIQQYYVLNYDTRSIGAVMSRSSHVDEKDFFTMLLDGVKGAEVKMESFARQLDLTREKLVSAKILPGAAAYTHYLAWLGHYATPGEMSAALLINLPVYARVIARFEKALRSRYEIMNTDYFRLWTLGLDYNSDPLQPAPDAIEEPGNRVIQRYIEEYGSRMETAARLLQDYELLFWNTVYDGK